DGDLEVGPEPLQVARVDAGGRLVLEQEVLVADTDDAVDLAGEDEAAARGTRLRVDDLAFECLLQLDDLELLARVARGVPAHHRGAEVPDAVLLFLLRAVHARAIDDVE